MSLTLYYFRDYEEYYCLHQWQGQNIFQELVISYILLFDYSKISWSSGMQCQKCDIQQQIFMRNLLPTLAGWQCCFSYICCFAESCHNIYTL